MRAIDARPIKKVAEAKQRKRKRLQVASLSLQFLPILSNAGSAYKHAASVKQLVTQCLCTRAHSDVSYGKHVLGRVSDSRSVGGRLQDCCKVCDMLCRRGWRQPSRRPRPWWARRTCQSGGRRARSRSCTPRRAPARAPRRASQRACRSATPRGRPWTGACAQTSARCVLSALFSDSPSLCIVADVHFLCTCSNWCVLSAHTQG